MFVVQRTTPFGRASPFVLPLLATLVAPVAIRRVLSTPQRPVTACLPSLWLRRTSICTTPTTRRMGNQASSADSSTRRAAQFAKDDLWDPTWKESYGEATIKKHLMDHPSKFYCSWFCPSNVLGLRWKSPACPINTSKSIPTKSTRRSQAHTRKSPIPWRKRRKPCPTL